MINLKNELAKLGIKASFIADDLGISRQHLYWLNQNPENLSAEFGSIARSLKKIAGRCLKLAEKLEKNTPQ